MNIIHCISFTLFIVITTSVCVFEVTTLELPPNHDKEFIAYRIRRQNVLNTDNSPTIPLPSAETFNSTTNSVNQVVNIQSDERKSESIYFFQHECLDFNSTDKNQKRAGVGVNLTELTLLSEQSTNKTAYRTISIPSNSSLFRDLPVPIIPLTNDDYYPWKDIVFGEFIQPIRHF